MAKTQLSRKGGKMKVMKHFLVDKERHRRARWSLQLYALVPNPLLSLSLHLLGKGSYLELHTVPEFLCLRETKKLPDAS